MKRLIVIASLLTACGATTRTIKIPESVMAKPGTAGSTPKKNPNSYVVKMSDGQRTWQMEIPVNDGSPSFQAVIPLNLGEEALKPPNVPQSEADREIIEAKKARGEKITEAKPGEQPRNASYLATIARARELFKRRQYELALMDIVELDRMYPDDERVLEMKGTLYRKLNRPGEAKKAWERVLSLNPNNQTVARALEELAEESE